MTTCLSRAGTIAEKLQEPSAIAEIAGGEGAKKGGGGGGEEAEAKERRSDSPRTCGWRTQRRNKRRGREGRRRVATLANEEYAFRNGLGRVCGEPVARR